MLGWCDDEQIRAMHASLQVELEKGEKAYKRIKDQVSTSSRSFPPPSCSQVYLTLRDD
jgi:hypothetical protein